MTILMKLYLIWVMQRIVDLIDLISTKVNIDRITEIFIVADVILSALAVKAIEPEHSQETNYSLKNYRN